MTASERRRALAGLAPLLCVLVVCQVNSEFVHDDGSPAGISQYEENPNIGVTGECLPGRDVEAVALGSGSFAASAAARSCLDTVTDGEQQPAAEVEDPERGVQVRYASGRPERDPEHEDPFADQMLFTCTYELSGNLVEPEPPATCTGTSTWTIAAAFLPGGGIISTGSLQLGAERIVSGPEPESSFSPTVSFSCGAATDPPDEPVDVPVDGRLRRVASITADEECTIAVTLDGSARAAGVTVHQVRVTVLGTRRYACLSDAGCAGGQRCSSSSLRCTSGLANDLCNSGYDPTTGSGDCGPEAPICAPSGRCSRGEEFAVCGFPGLGIGASDAFCAEGFACTGGAASLPRCEPVPPAGG